MNPADLIRSSDLEIEGQLDHLVRRLDPFATAIYCCRALADVRRQSRPFTHAIPHVVARIIEANCAYCRPRYREPIDERRYRLAHNLLSQHSQEFEIHALEVDKDPDLFAQHAYRQQLELQYSVAGSDLGQLGAMYLTGSHAERVQKLFQSATGLPLPFLVGYSVLIYNHLRMGTADPQMLRGIGTTNQTGTIDPELVERYLDHAGCSPSELGERYKRERLASIAKPYLRSMVPSGLLFRPLLCSDDGEHMCAPFPAQVIRSATLAPFRFDSTTEAVRQAASDAFEEYVFARVQHYAGVSGLECVDIRKHRAGHKSCDFALVGDRWVILIECKSSASLPTFMLPHTLAKSGIATELGDAFRQLAASIPLLGQRRESIYGLVVTLNRLPFPNSQWFVKHAVGDAVLLETGGAFSRMPQIVSTHELEQLLIYSRGAAVAPPDVIEQKLKVPHVVAGEWQEYLGDLMRGKAFPPLESGLRDVRAVIQTARALA